MKGKLLLNPKKPLAGTIFVPGDKSISHRAVMLASIASGASTINNFLDGEDCLRTIQAFQRMGVAIDRDGTTVTIWGKGISGLQEPLEPIYFGNSGTTARLLIGLLSGLPFFTSLYGDASLTKRPMKRVVEPLNRMGAKIYGRKNGEFLPLAIKGTKLTGIEYEMPVKSAQVKSSLLFAGLLAEGKTIIKENTKTRDHTENMLKAFGADLSVDVENNAITITNKNQLTATDIDVPGDISSAAFFLVGAAIVPESKLILKNVGLNVTRTGVIDVLERMGAKIRIENRRRKAGEEMGDIHISHGELRGTTIEGEIIPRLIDEIPILALLATQAEGKTIIKNAEELKVKETDRILAVTEVLRALGADIIATEDGMIIHGKTELTGGRVSAYDDHRIAMMIAIAALVAQGNVEIDDHSSISISYPGFFADLQRVTT